MWRPKGVTTERARFAQCCKEECEPNQSRRNLLSLRDSAPWRRQEGPASMQVQPLRGKTTRTIFERASERHCSAPEMKCAGLLFHATPGNSIYRTHQAEGPYHQAARSTRVRSRPMHRLLVDSPPVAQAANCWCTNSSIEDAVLTRSTPTS